MFQIRRLSDPRLSARVCGSFGLDGKNAFAYAAFQKEEVLATAVFTLEGGCVVLEGADTGRRTDLALIDGMARAAFAAQLRNGAESARLGDRLPVREEEKFLLQWLEWGFSPEAAALAYEKTVLKCHEFKWSYCNGILRRWHEAGLHTVEEIEAGDKRSKPAPSTGAQAAPGKAGSNAWMRKYIQQREKEG